MEKSHKSLSLFEFQQRFATDNQCLAYLAAEKWKDGYLCPKCGHTHYCQGNTLYSRQCTRCKHTASPTSGTLFHKVKFPLLKAFYIVYFVSTNKKGISSMELSRKLELRQKTCWYFKHKADIEAYIDEYSYRFNRYFMNASIFDNLIRRMIKAKQYYLYD